VLQTLRAGVRQGVVRASAKLVLLAYPLIYYIHSRDNPKYVWMEAHMAMLARRTRWLSFAERVPGGKLASATQAFAPDSHGSSSSKHDAARSHDEGASHGHEHGQVLRSKLLLLEFRSRMPNGMA
jgi:hypothetical protein